jgi:hypothetical protein
MRNLPVPVLQSSGHTSFHCVRILQHPAMGAQCDTSLSSMLNRLRLQRGQSAGSRDRIDANAEQTLIAEF